MVKRHEILHILKKPNAYLPFTEEFWKINYKKYPLKQTKTLPFSSPLLLRRSSTVMASKSRGSEILILIDLSTMHLYFHKYMCMYTIFCHCYSQNGCKNYIQRQTSSIFLFMEALKDHNVKYREGKGGSSNLERNYRDVPFENN